MREPTLEYMQAMGAPAWMCRMYFPHEFRRECTDLPALKEDREMSAPGLATMKLQRRRHQPKLKRQRRVRVERYRPSLMDFAVHVRAEAQFAAEARRAHELAEMSSLECLEEMKKGAK